MATRPPVPVPIPPTSAPTVHKIGEALGLSGNLIVVPVPVPIAAAVQAPPPLPLPADGGLPIGRHLFEDLSGTAGTGKTWMARELVACQPGVVLTATTGIAAINLGEGTTINALLGYFDTAALETKFINLSLHARLRALRAAGVQRIVLDEKSMLDGFQLTHLVRAIEQVNDPRGGIEVLGMTDAEQALHAQMAEEAAHQPPIGLTLIGDFGQLSPVKAPFAFESVMWDRFAAKRTILTQVHRQADQDFIRGLQAVRMGDATEALRVFTPDLFQTVIDDSYVGSTIFAKNLAVANYNQVRLDHLLTPVVTCTSSRRGKQRGEWKLIPQTLRLKEGALVMILANRRVDYGTPEERFLYVNGDLGRFVGFDNDGDPIVDLYRTGEAVAVTAITRECLEPLTPARRKLLTDEREAAGLVGESPQIKGKHEIVGEITYTPLRLAWGTTTHKSQGLTLDRCQINLSDGFFKHPGMLFVALSRARTLDGLRLVGTPQQFAGRCVVNPVVRPWL